MKKEELSLIREAVNDSEAFRKLFEQYRPLVLKVLKPYNLREFSYEDWLQEARIAMIKAVARYDGSSGSQFGPYYRMVLQSHLSSILRRHFAHKRRIDATAIPFKASALESLQERLAIRSVEDGLLMRVEFFQLLENLSPLEYEAFETAVLHPFDTPTSNRFRRALERSRAKIIKFTRED